MPEHEIDGGEIWLDADEEVVKTIRLGRRHLGLITTRKTSLYYASVLRLTHKPGYRFDVPQWWRSIDRSECDSMAGAEEVIREFEY